MHAQKVWEEFGIRDLGDYHDLYLRTDVALLANVYEAFRDTCLKHYKLDPVHFYTSLGLPWKACLKHTGIKLELLTDPDMLLMFVQGSEVELLKWFINTHQQIINIWEIDSTQDLIPPIFSTQTQTICMVGQCHNLFQLEDLNGLM